MGHTNPSGKLAETFPASQTDVASDRWFPGTARQSQYREGIWVGYRYFDSANIEALFPFGHGLSYTQFEYSDLTIIGSKVGGSERIEVSCTIKNTGERAGAETVQFYVGQQNPSVPRPRKELKNFEKVYLEVGESKAISFSVSQRDLAFWSTENSSWVAQTDDYTFFIGASVSDIRLQETITVSTNVALSSTNKELEAYFEPAPEKFTDQAFRQLLGRVIPAPLPTKPFHTNSMVSETQSTLIGRKIRNTMRTEILSMMGDIPEENQLFMEAMIEDMPLRNVSMMSEGKLSEKRLHQLIHLMNKDWLKAMTGAPAESK
jgi:beta-glucosidase